MSEDKKNIINEPIGTYGQPLTFESVWLMFQETERILKAESLRTEHMFQETDKKFQETDRSFQEMKKFLLEKSLETDKKFKEIQTELGGIGNSNGQIAEDFFFSALSQSMSVGKWQFEEIGRNFRKKKNTTEAEYDIILYNEYKVLVIEVKYVFKKTHLLKFYRDGLKNFRFLFPEYKHYKLFGGIAGMTFEDGVLEEAEEFGFVTLTQCNENFTILNSPLFEMKEVK